MYKRISIFMLAITFLISVSLAGCGTTNTEVTKPVSGNGSNSATNSPKPIKVAISHTSAFTVGLPYYVGVEKGFYQQAGLKLEAVFTKGGSTSVQAVIAGDADIATEIGTAAVLSAYMQGAPLKIIAASTTGLDLYWYVKADSPLNSIKDLSGQKVGFSNPGSSSYLGVAAINQLLKAQGLPPASAEAAGDQPENLSAVLTGQLAAGWGQPPFGGKEVRDGKIRILFKATDIEEYKNVAGRIIFGSSKFVKEQPETARAFLDAQWKSWQWIFDHPDEAIAIWIKGADLKDDPVDLKPGFDVYNLSMVRMAPLDGVQKIIDDALALKFIDKKLTDDQIKDLFDTRYAPVYTGDSSKK